MRIPGLLILAMLLAAGTASAADEALARRLLNSQGCKACHRLDADGGTTGPDLSNVGSRLTKDQLRSSLVNPQQGHATGRIGDFSHLQAAEIDALTAFLESRK